MAPTIKIVKLKSRKKEQVYVKQKGYPGRYYTYQQGQPLHTFAQHYTATTILGQKHKSSYRQQQEQTRRRKQRTRKTRTHKQGIQKGIHTVIIPNIHTETHDTYHNKKKQLLQKAILDQQLLEIMLENQNMNKIKDRLQTKITVYNQEGEEIATAQKFFSTPDEIRTELVEEFTPGNEYDYIGNNLRLLQYTSINSPPGKERLGSIKVQIIFRQK